MERRARLPGRLRCRRHSQAGGFYGAIPLRWDKRQLSKFCAAGAFDVSLVPRGAILTPPAKNEFDHEAYRKLVGGYDKYAAPTAPTVLAVH